MQHFKGIIFYRLKQHNSRAIITIIIINKSLYVFMRNIYGDKNHKFTNTVPVIFETGLFKKKLKQMWTIHKYLI